MGEEIPRRLRRFRRRQQPVPGQEGEIDLGGPVQAAGPDKGKELNRQITMQLALDEVERFKERHKRLPKKKEYDSIAESIYRQLKDEDKRKRLLERHEKKAARRLEDAGKKHGGKRTGKANQAEPKQAALSELKSAAKGLGSKGIEGMKVEDLFGTEKKGKKEALGDEFSLEGMSDMDSGQGPEEKAGCPNCGNSTEDVVFCPECGTAFCESCAKNVEKAGNVKKLVCPSCGKKIKH